MYPDLSRAGEWYHGYIKMVPQDDIKAAFSSKDNNLIAFLNSIPESKHDHRYAEGKWTIKEVLQHIIDAERVFAYRALRFARKDQTPLPGFDENLFAENSRASARQWNDLVEEFKHVRRSSEIFFNSLDEDQLEAGGISSNNPIYVRALGYIIIGHALHHQKILAERYL
ncbi:MAG: DinB family protein [Chitinophagaceae bacterium]